MTFDERWLAISRGLLPRGRESKAKESPHPKHGGPEIAIARGERRD